MAITGVIQIESIKQASDRRHTSPLEIGRGLIRIWNCRNKNAV